MGRKRAKLDPPGDSRKGDQINDDLQESEAGTSKSAKKKIGKTEAAARKCKPENSANENETKKVVTRFGHFCHQQIL